MLELWDLVQNTVEAVVLAPLIYLVLPVGIALLVQCALGLKLVHVELQQQELLIFVVRLFVLRCLLLR